MLHLAPRIELRVAWQMNLAVFQQDIALGPHQDGGVEPALADQTGFIGFVRDLAITEMKADAVALGRREQRRGFVRRHGGFEPEIGLGDVLMIMARKERGQRQFGEHHQLHPAFMRPLHQPHHALHRDGARFRLLDRPELSGGDGKDAGHVGFSYGDGSK